MLIAAIWGVYRWRYAYQKFGPAVVWRWATPAIVATAILAFIGVASLITLLRLRAISVSTFRFGMIFQRGQNHRYILWRQIRLTYTTAFSYGLSSYGWRSRQELLLVLLDGSKLRLENSLADIEELADTIKVHVYPDLLVEYTDAFLDGRSLPFDPLRITGEGIVKGRQKIAWKDFAEVKFTRGKLHILPEDQNRERHIMVPAHTIPNVEICAQLIERIGRQQ
jgi:hypothetical protein